MKTVFKYAINYSVNFAKTVITGLVCLFPIVIHSIEGTAIGKCNIINANIFFRRLFVRTKEGRSFYLKVYRDDENALRCIQNWLEVISYYDAANVFILCDSIYLKKMILEKCRFPDHVYLEFMRTRKGYLKSVCKNLHSKSRRWRNAAYAHILPFYHSSKQNTKQHWDIDADDTMFLLNPDKTYSIMKSVENIATDNDISAFSLDMWRSRSKAKYWTFGVLFVNDIVDYCSIFNANKDKTWMESYSNSKLERFYNTDWFFTYLKDNKIAKIESFYVKNASFVHWGANCLSSPIYGGYYRWTEDRLIFPILKYIFKDDELGDLDTYDCIQVDINLTGNESSEYLRNHYGVLDDYERRRFGLYDHI